MGRCGVKADNEAPQTIVDRSDLRKWFSMVPNLVDDSDLDPFERALLHHYYRVGNCFEGLEKTAEKCHMSEGKASQARTALWTKGWIDLEKIPVAGGHGFRVTVVDKWEENFAFYSARKRQASPHEAYSPHQVRPQASSGEGQASLHEDKKNKEEEQKTEGVQRGSPPAAAQAPAPRHPALLAYQSAAKLNADKAAEESIIEAVGSGVEDVAYWKTIVRAWALGGYNKRNVGGQLECFKKKQMPGPKKHEDNGNGARPVKVVADPAALAKAQSALNAARKAA